MPPVRMRGDGRKAKNPKKTLLRLLGYMRKYIPILVLVLICIVVAAVAQTTGSKNIGKLVDGDIIEIDIPNRTINVKLSDEELASRPMTPVTRDRVVSKSLRAYASMVSSADKGGVRIID